ncbi:MAG: ribonuclease D, partial [Cutibacterium avidum]|nr:ribonuclease D [Cutibacterium avidum]
MSDFPVLAEPREGVPPVVASPEALRHTCQALQNGHGPVAIDTERAHGFRYNPRAYLIQLRREGSGTHLVDPVSLGETNGLKPLADALTGTQWILHAATQDMPCLAMDGLRPDDLFDTELAGRLLGLPRVG